MAPRKAPCVKEKKSNSGKVLAILSYFTVFIWQVFNYICNCFDWGKTDPIDTKENDRSQIIFDDYFEANKNVSNSNTNLKTRFRRLGKDVQDKVEQFGKDLQQESEAEIEAFSAKLNDGVDKWLILQGNQSRHELKKPTKEQDCDFKKRRQEVKKAVENCLNDEKVQESKQQESSLKRRSHENEGPKMLQCSGGDGNDSPSKNQATMRESECNQATANPSGNGYTGNNDGGFGDDGNGPPTNNPSFLKGHYRESAVPQKNKDELPQMSVVPVPYSESIESKANEDRSSAKNEDGSTSLGLDNMSLSDDKNAHCEASDNQNENGPGAMSMIENVSSAMNEIGSSTAQVNTSSPLDNMSLSDDRNDNCEVSDNEQRYPERIRTFTHNENETRSPYKILYPFQTVLNVGAHDGLYMLNRDFIILREIDRGMFGVCFEILDLRSGKKFAVKKILCKKFHPIELKIWSKISPTHVVTLLGAYDDGDHVHIFMELMNGTFNYIIDNREELNLTEKKVAALMKPVLESLRDIHGEGYVHADVKPENTFIGNTNIKLGDFGLAVDLRESTKNIGIRGTVPYMPKESFCGDEYRASVDIYAAGCEMIHLLSGALPWEGYARDTIIFKVGSGEIPEIPNYCSQEMKILLKNMVHPDHKERPTAKELLLLHPIFSDTQESVLDDVLQEVLVDIQLLMRPVIPSAQEVQDVDYINLAFSTTTLDDGGDAVEEKILHCKFLTLFVDGPVLLQEKPVTHHTSTESSVLSCIM